MLQSVITDRSINDLRDSLSDRPAPEVVHIHTTTNNSTVEHAAVKSPVKDLKQAKSDSNTIQHKFNKWNDLPELPGRRDGEARNDEVQVTSVRVLTIDPMAVEKPREAPVIVSKPAVVVKAVPLPENKPPLTLALPQKPAELSLFTEVVFPLALNLDLVKLSSARADSLSVQLRTALDADDVVFELRKALASQVCTQPHTHRPLAD